MAEIKIIAGPSREELFDGLRLRHEGRKVEITIKYSRNSALWEKTFSVSIDSVSIEDGSGQSWIVGFQGCENILGVGRHSMYFNTKTRTGTILSPKP